MTGVNVRAESFFSVAHLIDHVVGERAEAPSAETVFVEPRSGEEDSRNTEKDGAEVGEDDHDGNVHVFAPDSLMLYSCCYISLHH